MFYRNVVANLTHSDSVSDFLNYFVKNFRLDLPGEAVPSCHSPFHHFYSTLLHLSYYETVVWADKVIEADLLNLAMRSFAYRQQVDSATAIFNLMLPVPERLPCKIEVILPACTFCASPFPLYSHCSGYRWRLSPSVALIQKASRSTSPFWRKLVKLSTSAASFRALMFACCNSKLLLSLHSVL